VSPLLSLSYSVNKSVGFSFNLSPNYVHVRTRFLSSTVLNRLGSIPTLIETTLKEVIMTTQSKPAVWAFKIFTSIGMAGPIWPLFGPRKFSSLRINKTSEHPTAFFGSTGFGRCVHWLLVVKYPGKGSLKRLVVPSNGKKYLSYSDVIIRCRLYCNVVGSPRECVPNCGLYYWKGKVFVVLIFCELLLEFTTCLCFDRPYLLY
jgi:hypothetical protein